MANRVTEQAFALRVKNKHDDLFSWDASEYVSIRDPLGVYCNNHKKSIRIRSADSLYHHNPCKLCRRDIKFEKHKQKFYQSLHANYKEFTLKTGDINDFNQEIVLECPKHGDQTTDTNTVIFSRFGCFPCGRELAAKKITGRKRVSFPRDKKKFKARFGDRMTLISDGYDFITHTTELVAQCANKEHPPVRKSATKLMNSNGCKYCHESQGERLIRLALEALKIDYEQEKRFADCRDRKELPFDFWLPDFATLIEFQGQQHFVSARRFGGDKALKGTRKRDQIKREWANDRGINLITIQGYGGIKHSILSGLEPTEGYDPQAVSREIADKEAAWVQAKWDTYKKRLDRIFKGALSFDNTTWAWGQRNIDYLCPAHGEKSTDLFNLLRGHGCNECAGTYVPFDTFRKRSIKKYGDIFDFDADSYQGMAVAMKIVCAEHGTLEITPERHIYLEHGCPDCSDKARPGSSEKFLHRCAEKFGDRFDYSELGFTGALNPVTITCRRHQHSFSCMPGDHLRNEPGCCEFCVEEKKSADHSKSVIVNGRPFPSMRAGAKAHGLDDTTVRARIANGWDVDKAFTTPIKSNPVSVEGTKYKNLEEASRAFGIGSSTVAYRMKRGWPLEKALKTPPKKYAKGRKE